MSIELQGGLGNQLFQLAALAYAGERAEAKLSLDISRLSFGKTERKFEIPNELLELLFKRQPKIVSKSGFQLLIMKFLWKMESYNLKLYFPCRHIATNIGYDGIFENRIKNGMLIGYFQTYVYSNHLNWPQRFRDLKIDNNYYNSLLTEMKEKSPTVLHIRGGDYLFDRSGIGNLDVQYFANCIYESRSANNLFWIFSDDASYAEEIAKDLHINYRLIDVNQSLNSLETLLLMSCAKKIIISNSTFAWWSAFLSYDSVIYAPDKWFKALEDPFKLIPKNWNLVKSRWKE